MQKLIKQERLSYTMEIFKEICQVIGLTLLWQKKYKNTKKYFPGKPTFSPNSKFIFRELSVTLATQILQLKSCISKMSKRLFVWFLVI